MKTINLKNKDITGPDLNLIDKYMQKMTKAERIQILEDLFYQGYSFGLNKGWGIEQDRDYQSFNEL